VLTLPHHERYAGISFGTPLLDYITFDMHILLCNILHRLISLGIDAVSQ
jgi:hypothetical protein